MKHLLARENAAVLAQLAFSKVLLAFDFDGTLAPIVESRGAAQMRASTRALFIEVCERYPCAVISGRSRDDVASRLGRAPVKYVVGNHGLEPSASLGEFEEQVATARMRLERSLADLPGLELEDKRYSLALHYRKSRQKRLARAAIHEAIARLPVPMREVAGKLVVNVVPRSGANKGDALLSLRATERADTALYVGDDVTDEDVFKLDQPGRLLTVRVGESRVSAAAYYLKNQQEIDRLLAKLVTLRGGGPTG